MRILPGIEIYGNALVLDNTTLIISDLHLGYEALQSSVMVPRKQWQTMKEKLSDIFSHFPITTVIVNGDIKHHFGGVLDAEWRLVLRFLDFLLPRKIILVEGNHDQSLKTIAQKRGLVPHSYFIHKTCIITHGDEIPPLASSIQTIIIGHEHPMITLTRGNRRESYKCFLRTKYKGKNLIIMPSFHELTKGSNVIEEKPLSPLLSSYSEAEVYAVDGTSVFDFGKVRNIAKNLCYKS